MKVLLTFPHHDDETIFAGGIISRHIKNGDEVYWICASYGEKGGNSEKRSAKLFYMIYSLLGKFPSLLVLQKISVLLQGMFRRRNLNLAKIRKEEAEKVANIFGINKIYFLNITDMFFIWKKKMFTQKFEKLLGKIKPDVIYTMHPNGITGHPDHEALSRYVTEVLKKDEKKMQLRYVTFSKEIIQKYRLPLLGISQKSLTEIILLSEEELEIKRKAIKTYKSQGYLWRNFLEKHPELIKQEFVLKV